MVPMHDKMGSRLSMNRGFVLVVLLVLVLDWVIVFEDEEEHEDESVHGPNAWEKSERGLSMNLVW